MMHTNNMFVKFIIYNIVFIALLNNTKKKMTFVLFFQIVQPGNKVISWGFGGPWFSLVDSFKMSNGHSLGNSTCCQYLLKKRMASCCFYLFCNI